MHKSWLKFIKTQVIPPGNRLGRGPALRIYKPNQGTRDQRIGPNLDRKVCFMQTKGMGAVNICPAEVLVSGLWGWRNCL